MSEREQGEANSLRLCVHTLRASVLCLDEGVSPGVRLTGGV